MRNKLSTAISLAVVLSMLLTSLALADGITADADALVMSPPQGNSINTTQSGGTTVSYDFSAYIKDTGNDSDNVFANSGDSVIATITRSGAWQVGGTPSTSLTFNAYASPRAGTIDITVPCGSAGTTQSMTVLLSAAASNGRNLTPNNATLSYNITAGPDASSCTPPPPSNTAPSVSVTGVIDGASYAKGSVPTATCQVTDAEDGNSLFAATLSTITGTYASDGIGVQTASCSYTDAGGLNASASVIYGIVDPSLPEISYTLNPTAPDGDNDWYVSDVTLTWTVSDPESPNSLSKTGCDNQNITADQAATTYSCSATSAGGSAGPVEVTIMRDATLPTIAGSASPAANGAGWNNTDVTISFTCDDNLSGVQSCGPNSTLTSQGAGQSVAGTVVDFAGNSDSATVSGINIDKTAPVVTVTGVTNGATYTLGSVPAAGCSTSDALSGVATNASLGSSGGPVGDITATCSGALDNAGNSGSASATYHVNYNWTGFFQPIDNLPILNRVKAGSAIPVKFSLSGNQGLNIFAAGYPVSTVTACGNTATDDVESTVTAGSSSLSYDALANQYVYVWKTDKAWAGTCHTLTVKLADGTLHQANFNFTR